MSGAKSVTFGEWLAQRRKALVSVGELVLGEVALLQSGVSGRALILASIVLVLGAVGVHQVPNAPTP